MHPLITSPSSEPLHRSFPLFTCHVFQKPHCLSPFPLLTIPRSGQERDIGRHSKWKEFVGTPEYMSPEAINNQDADFRADLWSFGCFVVQAHSLPTPLPLPSSSQCALPPHCRPPSAAIPHYCVTFLVLRMREVQMISGWPPFKGGSDYLTFKRMPLQS